MGILALRDRVLPYAHLLKTDPWGYPLVHHAGAFVVVLGTDRRESGTHYTPKSLTEKIVEETLTPLVYDGPAEGEPREAWRPKGSEALLDLKVCDPAMGSGAFLVQVCRFLSERLVEAWAREEDAGHVVGIGGHVADGAPVDPMPTDPEERAVLARRLVAERCLYGVDLNPLAVELAKLSLWLTTLSKGRPFGFLDHNLKSGDSLLGIQSLAQLTELRLEPTGDRQLRLFGQTIEQAVQEALDLRQRLREIPIRDIRDVEAMATLDAEARAALDLPEQIADAFVGAVFAGGSPKAVEKRLISLGVEADQIVQGDGERRREMGSMARRELAVDSRGERARQPFHWPLEYPEVFQINGSGFDAFVGNPPFLGGQHITGVSGTAYREWLVGVVADGRRGSADLVAYFFLRVARLLKHEGHFGLLAINTIAEGDTRHVGLEQLIDNGAVIHAAYPDEPWPGQAAVSTSRVHIRNGPWDGGRSLSGKHTSHISAFLSDQPEWNPAKLKSNDKLSFQGSITLGMGFVLSPEEASQMVSSSPRSSEVVFPYMNGDDLNSDAKQRPSRYVINFWDWPIDRAKEYEAPFQWLERNVKPERQRLDEHGEFELRRPLPQRWWQFGEKRPALYHAIGRGHDYEKHPKGWNPETEHLHRVIAFATQASKYPVFSFVHDPIIFSNAIGVIASSEAALLAELSSSLHTHWAFKHGGRLETRLRYSPTSCLKPYPFLAGPPEQVSMLGERLSRERNKLMAHFSAGITSLYNKFHDPNNRDDGIASLREIHHQIDLAVSQAYGWEDIDVSPEFREVPYLPSEDCVRFTISEPTRIELLKRLTELNRERYEQEVVQGLHGRKTGSKSANKRTSRRAPQQKKTVGASQIDMGFERTSIIGVQGGPLEAVLGYLHAHPGWHTKSDVLTSVALPAAQWSATISDLVEQGVVERKGQKRGTRYQAVAAPSSSRADTP